MVLTLLTKYVSGLASVLLIKHDYITADMDIWAPFTNMVLL